MFKKGEIFEGNLKFKAAPITGIIREFNDRERIEIIDVKDNIFTANISFFYVEKEKIYRNNIIGMGIYNQKKDKFKFIEALFQLPVTLENKDTIEVSLLKGRRCGDHLHLEFLEASNIQQKPGDNVVFAFEAKLNKIL